MASAKTVTVVLRDKKRSFIIKPFRLVDILMNELKMKEAAGTDKRMYLTHGLGTVTGFTGFIFIGRRTSLSCLFMVSRLAVGKGQFSYQYLFQFWQLLI